MQKALLYALCAAEQKVSLVCVVKPGLMAKVFKSVPNVGPRPCHMADHCQTVCLSGHSWCHTYLYKEATDVVA